jgi:ribulose 1,5-bisphosphate synthetase/thiazole synthase
MTRVAVPKMMGMMTFRAVLYVTLSLLATSFSHAAAPRDFDVLVYGGTSGGVTAAVQAARMGKRVALIEPGQHLGGLSSGGLGWTDMGNPNVVGGLSREFYHRVFRHYQSDGVWKHTTREHFAGAAAQHARAIDATRELMWVFEPHAAEKIFNDLAREANVTVVFNERLALSPVGGVVKDGSRIASMRMESGATFTAKVFIDATYEGDLMAQAGVKYAVGREGNDVYGETINGIQAARSVKNQLPPGIDPYVIKGDPSSGLLPGVNPNAGGPDGAGDAKIQAYCYRMCLTDVPENRVAIAKPAGYDEGRYELLFRAIEAGQTSRFFKFDLMPNRKTDSNNDSGISTDFIGQNYGYPEADYATRAKLAAAHEDWQRGLVWTLQNHPRVPAEIRAKYAKWGLPKDEFADNGNWSRQLYVRESRRMLGSGVATERSLRDDADVKRSIGMGAYAMDSHNAQRYVDASGHVRNEGDVQITVPRPYRIDYGTIVPKPVECTNLLVPVCLSASHIAYGSIRMEPVFMTLGHSAGAAACFAIDEEVSVQRVPYDKIRTRLIADGQVLEYTP